jgi:hypothetical protein
MTPALPTPGTPASPPALLIRSFRVRLRTQAWLMIGDERSRMAERVIYGPGRRSGRYLFDRANKSRSIAVPTRHRIMNAGTAGEETCVSSLRMRSIEPRRSPQEPTRYRAGSRHSGFRRRRLPKPNPKSFTISRDDAPAGSITIDARSICPVTRSIASG